MMEIEFVNRLIDIVERSQLSELEYTENDKRLRVVKARQEQGATQHPERQPDIDVPFSPEAVPVRIDLTNAVGVLQNHTVASPLTGVFFRAPAANQREFAQVGDFVEEGQPLAIVEAMKILNSIDADKSGRLVEVLVENGAEVEAGAALFVIEPMRGDDV
ncbi:acetyl-CoA carboxylase biotin carboxyl carrier protein [Cupriavidus sp. PET2-C1]